MDAKARSPVLSSGLKRPGESRSAPASPWSFAPSSLFSLGTTPSATHQSPPPYSASFQPPAARPTKRQFVDPDAAMTDDRPAPSEKSTEPDEDDQALSDSESFFELLRTFASLDLPQGPELPEQCPLCPEKYPLADFAPHVLNCIKKLDDVEKQHQAQLDAKLAQELSDEVSAEQFLPLEECPNGAGCARQDAQHFKALRHPLVPCPMCSRRFEIYQVNEHVTVFRPFLSCVCVCAAGGRAVSVVACSLSGLSHTRGNAQAGRTEWARGRGLRVWSNPPPLPPTLPSLPWHALAP
jgi:hypothetical protein